MPLGTEAADSEPVSARPDEVLPLGLTDNPTANRMLCLVPAAVLNSCRVPHVCCTRARDLADTCPDHLAGMHTAMPVCICVPVSRLQLQLAGAAFGGAVRQQAGSAQRERGIMALALAAAAPHPALCGPSDQHTSGRSPDELGGYGLHRTGQPLQHQTQLQLSYAGRLTAA